jgi:hypothetical protein
MISISNLREFQSEKLNGSNDMKNRRGHASEITYCSEEAERILHPAEWACYKWTVNTE